MCGLKAIVERLKPGRQNANSARRLVVLPLDPHQSKMLKFYPIIHSL